MPATTKAVDSNVTGFFAVRFASAHAKEMALYLEQVLGFHEVAYRSLETGSPCLAAHVMQCNGIIFEIANTVEVPAPPEDASDYKTLAEMAGSLLNYAGGSDGLWNYASARRAVQLYARGKASEHSAVQSLVDAANASFLTAFVERHSMGVCDVLFHVRDAFAVYSQAVAQGAVPLQRPRSETDANGTVITAVIGSPYSDLRHTLVQPVAYDGPYLPGYHAPKHTRPRRIVMQTNLLAIDHCVQNFSWNHMEPVADFYEKALNFHRFWSVDDGDVATADTGLRSVVMASGNEMVKMPINEPVKVRLKGQIEEFHDYFGGPGVQHVALRTDRIVEAVVYLRTRGMEFNEIAADYYDKLERRLAKHHILLVEDLAELRENHILVDFDPKSKVRNKTGYFSCDYILQIFSRPWHDRPTFFVEIIQRTHHNGFGKGTFKGLFESIERQQRERGTLLQ